VSIKKNWVISILIFGVFLIYLPALANYFSGDDWFHLRISQISSIQEFINFFSFTHTAQSAAFYRPLPTQVFFFVFQKLFGLNAWPYFLFVLICFGYSLYLVYKFAQQQLENKAGSKYFAPMAVLIYGISVSNFTRIYFLSAFQEISLVIFSLLCLISFPKNKTKAAIFFILALMSKETAVVLPILLVLFYSKKIYKNIISIVPIGLILLVYLYLRFMVFGGVEGDSYIWNFSPIKVANTLMWYILWSYGAPELLVDYVSSGLRLVPKFFTDYPIWWKLITSLLLGTLATSGMLFAKKIKNINLSQVKYILLFLIAILPVLFLPSHKFTLELGLPLVGFSLAIAWLITNKPTVFSYIFLGFYISLNLSMNYLTYTRHYSINRGKISREIITYLSANYQEYPKGKNFEFINDSGNYGDDWGQSKQISQSISSSDLFRVFYKNPDIKVYYQDYSDEIPKNAILINLSTKQFLH